MGGLSRIVDGNALLVGDAAALVNPLTAGGIRSALLSGRRAAEAIAVRDLRRYQEWWDSSGLSNPLFLKAFRSFERMSDTNYARMIRPFRRPFNLPLAAYYYATWPEFRDFIRSYVPSDRYGW
jgi:flavin-dependent dehydrogenase